MSGGMKVTFHGVRGSTPCDGPQLARYGGNTSCVAVEVEGQAPIVFDLGTGLRNFGLSLLEDTTFEDLDFHGTVLLSHLHWDHVQGLPFFVPLHRPGNTLDVYGPQQAEGPLGEVFTGMMQPPYFPITPDQLEGDGPVPRRRQRRLPALDHGEGPLPLDPPRRPDARVPARVAGRLDRLPLGPRPGVCRHPVRRRRSPRTASDDYVPDDVLDLCDGVDLLIHDAQHTPAEFEHKRHWGHCTVDYAVHVAKEAGVQRLALFHHDPAHNDDQIDMLRPGRTRHRRPHRRRRGARRIGGPGARTCTAALQRAPLAGVTEEAAATGLRHRDPQAGGRVVPLGPRPLRHRHHGHHRDGRRRAGRDRGELLHLGVARPAARALLRREDVVAPGRASSAPVTSA